VRKVLAALAAVAALSTLLCGPAAQAQTNGRTDLELYSGEAKVLPISTTRIAIGNGKVVSASSVSANQLLILGEAPGTSTLHLWLKNGAERDITVTVREADNSGALQDIKRLLANVDNVTARLAGSKIVLEGELVSDANQARVAAIQKMYPELVVNFIGKVGWEKMIYMDIKVVELSTKGSRDLGIRWDSSVNGPHAGTVADIYSNKLFRYVPDQSSSGLDLAGVTLPGSVWPPKSFITMASLITSRINLLVQDGEAEVLAAPTLTTRSGSTARFVVGGEIPLPVTSTQGRTEVTMKEYGIIVEVTPVTDTSGAIYAKVDVEVSSIDRSVTVLGVPGFLKRKSTAEFNSRDGETVVLNGMYSYEGGNDAQQLPGLGTLPLLGNLFRNKATSRNTREVAIIITPRVVQGTVSKTEVQPKDVNAERLEAVERMMRERDMLKKKPSKLTVTE
jgi:pilus assembly protein CpaC